MKHDVLKKRFEEVYQKESDAVFRYCMYRISDREVVLDMVQDIFSRYWDSLVQEKVILNDRAFIFTISRNLIIDYYRKKKSVSLDSIIDEVDDSTFILSDTQNQNSENMADARFVLEKINDLEPIHRQIVYFRFVEGLKPKDIADVLNVTPNVVSVRLVRALEKLREITGFEIKDE